MIYSKKYKCVLCSLSQMSFCNACKSRFLSILPYIISLICDCTSVIWNYTTLERESKKRCHLNYDRDEHKANAAKTRERKRREAGQLQLLEAA